MKSLKKKSSGFQGCLAWDEAIHLFHQAAKKMNPKSPKTILNMTPRRTTGFINFQKESDNQYRGEIQNPGLFLALVHLLHPEPPKNNGLPRKVCYFSSSVRILRPLNGAMVGVFNSKREFPVCKQSVVTAIS